MTAAWLRHAAPAELLLLLCFHITIVAASAGHTRPSTSGCCPAHAVSQHVLQNRQAAWQSSKTTTSTTSQQRHEPAQLLLL
jgi:hypothetical protein